MFFKIPKTQNKYSIIVLLIGAVFIVTVAAFLWWWYAEPDISHLVVSTPTRIFAGDHNDVMRMTVSADSKRLLGNAWNDTILWDMESGEIIRRLQHEQDPHLATLTPDGRSVVTSETGTAVAFYDAATGEVQRCFQLDFTPSIAYVSPDGNRLFVTSSDKIRTFVLLNVESGEKLTNFPQKMGGYLRNPFSNDSRYLLFPFDNTSTIYDTETGFPIQEFKSRINKNLFTVFSPDGSRLLVVGLENDPVELETRTGRVLRTFKGHSNIYIYGRAYSSDGRFLYTASHQELICWDAESGAIRYKLEGSYDPFQFAPSPDGQLLMVVESQQRIFRRWGGGTPFEPILNPIQRKIEYWSGKNPQKMDEKTNAIHIYDNRSGELLRVIPYSPDCMIQVVMAPDGHSLIVTKKQYGQPTAPLKQQKAVELWDISDLATSP